MGQPPPHGQEVGLFIVSGKKKIPTGYIVTLTGISGSATFYVSEEDSSYYVLQETLQLNATKP